MTRVLKIVELRSEVLGSAEPISETLLADLLSKLAVLHFGIVP